MNNTDISNLIKMINEIDKKQLSKGITQLNQLLSDNDKKRLQDLLNNQNNH